MESIWITKFPKFWIFYQETSTWRSTNIAILWSNARDSAKLLQFTQTSISINTTWVSWSKPITDSFTIMWTDLISGNLLLLRETLASWKNILWLTTRSPLESKLWREIFPRTKTWLIDWWTTSTISKREY